VVNRDTGHKFSHKPLSHERALRQIRAIYANTRGLRGGVLVGGKCTELIDPFSQEDLRSIPQKYRIDILVGTNPATGETIEHCFDIRQLCHYFVASQTTKNPYINDDFKPNETKFILEFLSDPRLGNFQDKVEAISFLDGSKYFTDKLGKLSASYMKYNAEWIINSFLEHDDGYFMKVSKQFDFINSLDPEILNNINYSLKFLTQNDYYMIATSVFTDEFGGRRTMAEARDLHDPTNQVDVFPNLEAPNENIAREAIFYTMAPQYKDEVIRYCVKINHLLHVEIPHFGGMQMGGVYYPPSKDFLNKFIKRLFVNTPKSIGLTYIFIKALFEGLITTNQIKLVTRTICSYKDWAGDSLYVD